MTTRLELDRYLDLLRADTERIADILETGDLAAPVPACPEWTLGDLAFHIGQVHEFWCWVARERVPLVDEDHQAPRGPTPDDSELASWLRAGLAALVPPLRDGDPSTPMWSWTSQHDRAFIQRRMPQETAVHRWDAESVAGKQRPIAPDLAADGIDEFFLLASAGEPTEGRERVRLRTTDTGHTWVADVVGGTQVLVEGGGDADAELVGTASDLLLVLWRRLPASAVTVDGDLPSVDRFLGRADLS